MLGTRQHSAEDSLLLSQMRTGSSTAFDTLYDKYKKEVFNEAYKRLNDIEQAKDITQDIFIALWVKASESPIDNLPGYLYTAIKNNVIRFLQRAGKFLPLPDLLQELHHSHSNHADADLLYKELVKAYHAVVESLPEQQRIIYKMRYEDNLDPKEIARKLHLSEKTVRNHLGRALSRLRPLVVLIPLVLWLGNK